MSIWRSRGDKASNPPSPAIALAARPLLHRSELIDRLIDCIADGSESTIGVLGVCVSLGGVPAFDFNPLREDLILKASIERARRALREADLITALSPNELCIVLPRINGPAQAELAAVKLLRALEAPLTLGEGKATARFELKVAIGIACAPDHGNQPEALIRGARESARAAVTRDPPYLVFDQKLWAETNLGEELLGPLRRALRENELVLHYQTQVEIATGRTVAAEALARWFRADGTSISPGIFIPLAERSSLMSLFTRWTLNTGMRQLSECRAAGIDMSMSINISPVNLEEHEFPELVAQSLAMWSVKPEAVTLEITETTPIRDATSALAMLHRLKKVGVRLAIDDFGTGYSSLALLRQMPVDELKIDQQFINGMLNSTSKRQIVRSVLDLANNFGLISVAEGVEDEATLNALQEMGCTLAQGYYIARPVSREALLMTLSKPLEPSQP